MPEQIDESKYDLEACPHCSGSADVFATLERHSSCGKTDVTSTDEIKGFHGRCTSCGATGPRRDTAQAAAQAWNTRPAMTRAAGLAERFNIFVKNHTYRTSPMRADWEEIIDILGGLITPEYWAKFNFKEFDRLTDENSRFKSSLEEIALGDGTYGAQAHEYKQIARKALKPPEKEGWKE